MKVKCPRCKTETVYSSKNEFRPFCSERCRLIDLGAWAEGSYVVVDNEGASVDERVDRTAPVQKKTEEI